MIRPSADLGIIAGQVLENLPEAMSRSPFFKLAMRNLVPGQRSPEADLLSYLLFDGEFLDPLAELGYRDAVPPREALVRTARWLAAHPPAPGGPEEQVLQDPFDYAAEDALVAAWRRAKAGMPEIAFAREPGFGLAYSGPGGRARSQVRFE